MRRSLVTGIAASLAFAAGAQADILWNQLPAYDNFSLSGFPNRVTASDAIFAVTDVTVPAGGWTIDSVTTYFTDFSFNPTVTQAILNIFPKTGALPVAINDPRPSPTGQGTLLVPVDIRTQGGTSQQPAMNITASGLNISLPAGDYWIGLTPALSSGPFGSDSHWPTEVQIGSPTAVRGFGAGPGAAFPWSTLDSQGGPANTDLALTVTGVPSPSSLAILGVAGLVTARRRR
jgi:hypothetical protein